MGRTITVTTTPAAILRDAARTAREPGPKSFHGEDGFDRQARVIDELGYAVVAKAGDALGPVAVELLEAPNHTPVEDDDGRSAGLPTWPLSSGVRLADQVMAWPGSGVELGEDGDTVFSEEGLAALERDALAVLAAIATHRRAARRVAAATGEAGRG